VTGDKEPRYEIRGAVPGDEEPLLSLARELNTVNLPNDGPHIERLLSLSARSFSGEIAPRLRRYVFLLWDKEKERAAGTSMIVAQLGRRGAPYIYFDVHIEERYAASVDKHFHHTLLRIGFSYDGPTELGGLVVAPAYRKAPERLGLLISYVRFLFIAGNRPLFRDDLLAELLPPLEPDGTSHLWEAVGRRFTDMSYAEADLLSSENKDFIRDLFPRDAIYVTLLSQDAQSIIGRVGAQTKGVEKMLRRVGFEYLERVDPFDGGPHFGARTDDVTLVQETRTVKVGERPAETSADSQGAKRFLVGKRHEAPPYFRSVEAIAGLGGDGVIALSEPIRDAIRAAPGDEVFALPLP